MAKNNTELKHVGDLGLKNFRHYPVWTWWQDDPDESLVEPVSIGVDKTLDVGGYLALFIFCKIQLKDGTIMEGSIALNGYRQGIYNLDFYKENDEFGFVGTIHGSKGKGTLEELEKWIQKPIEMITPVEYFTGFFDKNNEPIAGRIDLRDW